MEITDEFVSAVQSREPVTGFTHDFYRYPARFSPVFARAAIRSFSAVGDTVVDPFVGGGTTLVEAQLLGRNAVGTDINSLAVFISQVKTTMMSDRDLLQVKMWAHSLRDTLNLRNPPAPAVDWAKLGYQRNINTRRTWPIRKSIELALARVKELGSIRQQRFARCVLLKTAQWALDCRAETPSVRGVRQQFTTYLDEMISGARAYSDVIRTNAKLRARSVRCLCRSAAGIEADHVWDKVPPPKLILTSPPYPGVHVLYHRWQIEGRRETPAPFWICGTLDGHGASFYTFGDRKHQGLSTYFDNAQNAFRSLALIAHRETTVVQMVAFSDPSWQLPFYLAMMNTAGFEEFKFERFSGARDGRLWRAVPNRKWYATQRGDIGASKEVVLFHRLRRPS
jgi:hypothetical protein